jgi:ATP-dependent Clp protease protease subunit
MRTIRIDGPIGQEPGEISAKWFRSQLPADGSPITVFFHSEGGSVFESFSIFDAIKAYSGRKTAIVESMAFSAASLLLCAFDDVAISPNGYTMVHAPYFDSEELPKSERQLLASLRERMIGIYSEKTGKPIATISKLVDQETFLDAESSISLGIVNRVARASSTVVARMPARILAKIKAASPGATATAKWKAAVAACAGNVTLANKQNPGLRLKMLAEFNKR